MTRIPQRAAGAGRERGQQHDGDGGRAALPAIRPAAFGVVADLSSRGHQKGVTRS